MLSRAIAVMILAMGLGMGLAGELRADDASDRRMAAVARQRVLISQLEEKARSDEWSSADFRRLLPIIRYRAATGFDDPIDSLVIPARELLARQADAHTAALATFLHEGSASISHSSAADLVITSMMSRGSILPLLVRENLVDATVLAQLFNHGDLHQLNLPVGLGDQVKIMCDLHHAGVQGGAINRVLKEAVTTELAIAPGDWLMAVQTLHSVGVRSFSVIDALKQWASGERHFAGGLALTLDQRLVAVQAIAEMRQQESVAALWRIEGLKVVTNEDVAVVARARFLRENLQENGHLRPPAFRQRLARWGSQFCGSLLRRDAGFTVPRESGG